MALFTSEYPFKVDRKGRVSVPAEYRATLSQQRFAGIVLVPVWEEPAFDGFGHDRLEELAASLDDPEVYDEEELEEVQQLFSEARRLPFDGDGRIVLPEDVRAHADITDQVYYVGRGTTFRLWNPAAYNEHKAKIRSSAKSKGKTVRLRLAPRKKKEG